MSTPPPYVSHVGKLIFVDQCYDLEEKLKALGFEEDKEITTRHCFQKIAPESNADLAKELGLLRDHGIAFSRGQDWSPAAIFLKFREDNLITGTFLEIGWKGPNDWKIFET